MLKWHSSSTSAAAAAADDGVQLHSLPELRLVSTASRTARGAAAFAWDDARQLLVTAWRKKV
jgi:hypothetical protein